LSPRSERGSVTLVSAALLAAAMILATGVADLARVFVASAKAQTAADAAALAAAQELAMPSSTDPQSMARAFAEQNGGSLTQCRCSPGAFEAVVRVRVPVGSLLLFTDDRWVEAPARAIVEGSPPG
jgi:secretion/DNA translocation related TadE-like protein